ncbi:hypothetical protein DDP36_07205 [Helicobacter pylori]|nr:hypothetical protein DDP36_07205 [Helicobacter pylori]
MFLQSCFLFDFIIDYILVLYFSVVFSFFLFLVVLIWGFIVLFKGFRVKKNEFENKINLKS